MRNIFATGPWRWQYVQRVQTRSWADYPISTFPEVPAVAAIVNAMANATGKCMRDLPFTRDRVKAVLT